MVAGAKVRCGFQVGAVTDGVAPNFALAELRRGGQFLVVGGVTPSQYETQNPASDNLGSTEQSERPSHVLSSREQQCISGFLG